MPAEQSLVIVKALLHDCLVFAAIAQLEFRHSVLATMRSPCLESVVVEEMLTIAGAENLVGGSSKMHVCHSQLETSEVLAGIIKATKIMHYPVTRSLG